MQMKFGDRLKQKRLEAEISQQELAKITGISARSVQNYESNKRYPNSLAITVKLAEALGTTSEYLLAEEGQYIIEAEKKGGAKARRDVETLVGEMRGLFAGGTLSEGERDAVMRAVSDAYWLAKEENIKYSPRKTIKDE